MPVQKKERGNILGKQFLVNDLIAYQEGAVVSRTLIDKKVGTVTIFAFDEGQGLSEHTAPFDAMAQILDGQVEIKISDDAHYDPLGGQGHRASQRKRIEALRTAIFKSRKE
jgi:hypothetical protein